LIHPKIIQKAITTMINRSSLLRAFLLVLASALMTLTATAADKPVKVYILSGQSNMVGIGQANPSGMTRYNTYVSADKDAKKGATLSIYRGAYNPDTDYDKLEPIETHHVMLGYWPHTSFPAVDEPSTHVARAFIRIERAGRYSFKSANGSMLELDGKIICETKSDAEPKTEIVKLQPGTYPIKVTYFARGRSNLTYKFYDVPGSLHTVVKEEGKYPDLVNEDGEWASRDDVWYKGVVTAGANKWLSVGCGASDGKVGPELGFGWVIGDYHDEPVLILKTSQGNRSLAWDFLPPGSERYEVGDKVYAGYKDRKPSWDKGTTPEPVNWYAGKQYDDCVNAAKEVLENFDENFPHWKGRGYEIAGFGWWQGHKDTGSEVHAARYEQNLVHLIKTLRRDFQAPDAPFVVATIGFGGWEMEGNTLTVANAQLTVSGDKGKYPDFKGNVRTIETRDFWRSAEESPRNQGYHYNQNGETYLNVGQAMGKGMIELLKANE
jgi:alpha-galactosidase